MRAPPPPTFNTVRLQVKYMLGEREGVTWESSASPHGQWALRAAGEWGGGGTLSSGPCQWVSSGTKAPFRPLKPLP